MSRGVPIILLLVLSACATSGTTATVDRRDRYLTGHAAAGPVAPAEFTYENRDASLQFPPEAAAPTLRQIEAESLDGGSDWPERGAAGMSEDLYGGGYGGSGDDYWENDYGGSGRQPGAGRPRPPGGRPPPKPPIEKPDRPKPDPVKEPRAGPDDRERAKAAPGAPERSRGGTQPPSGGRKK